jgi:hypothetical protein
MVHRYVAHVLLYAMVLHNYDLLCTHNAMPPSTNAMPIQVSLLITFFSAHHSPSTVNKNASEFVIGTVRLNSTHN